MMKISAILVSMILNPSYAVEESVEVAMYGGCFNTTAYKEDPSTGFTCHFTKESCLEGEKWLSPKSAEKRKLPKCTCDEDFGSNVHVNSCYSMVTHQVSCQPSDEPCPDTVLGTRYNHNHAIPETCGHGSAASSESRCGKRCTCNFKYQSRAYQVMAGTTMYGMCYNTGSHQAYCAATKSSCDSSEMYVESSNAMASECPCTDVQVGACISNKGKFAFCAVSADSCGKKDTFLKPLELANSEHDHNCRLCEDTWNCADRTDFTRNDKSCFDMSNEKKPRKKFCKFEDVKTACPVMCGDCCADDMSLMFTVLEEAEEINCAGLKLRDDKKDICESDEKVSSVCARTCGRCCTDDATYKFKDENGKKRNCEYVASRKPNSIRKICRSNNRVRRYCPNTCDNCKMS